MKRIFFTLLFIGALTAQNSVVKQFSDAFADVAEKTKPAVVTIITDKVVSINDFDSFGFFFHHPNQSRKREFKTNALGSGVIIDAKNGYILTNNHVVDDMDGIQVRLIDKREFEATIVGTDPKTDLAVLQIDADELTDVKLGDSEHIRVGEWVMAVGSPFSENLSHTVTTGIVSALGRSNIMNTQSYEDFIQTDAAINPGNSGGALLNMNGELIGINTAIATGGTGRANRGVGFAIPSNMAHRVMTDLIDKGFVTRSWLGVGIDELDAETARMLDVNTLEGVLITEVFNGSPAESAGIEEGDVIIEFDGEKIVNPSNLKNVVSLTPPHEKSNLKLIRDGRKKSLNVILQELPDNPTQYASRERSQSNEFGFTIEKATQSLRDKYNIKGSDALVVTDIDQDGIAYKEGIREGDIIRRVGTDKVTSVSEFYKLAKASKSKGAILLLVKKQNGASRFLTLNY